LAGLKGRPVKVSPARRLAWSVLLAVSEKGDRAEAALSRRLAQIRLSQPDRALASELVYGVLRWQGWLDYVLGRFSRRPLAGLSIEVLSLLRLGAYQILRLDRVPDRAAVHTSVELARTRFPEWTAGFVNAVLRAVAEKGPGLAPPPAGDGLAAHLAASQSHPAWLVERWLEELGEEETRALLAANNTPPGLCLRVRLEPGREALAARLAEAGLETRPGLYSPQALYAPGSNLERLEEVAPGLFTAQAEAAQLVGLAAAPPAGGRVLDLCAGVGGKTGHLAELMADRGLVLALDKDAGRLEVGRERLARLGLKSVRFQAADVLQALPPEASEPFDAVLVDAPCSGLGVLRGRPEVRWRLSPQDPARLARLQTALLGAAADLVRPGGTLVYATCSLLGEENQAVVSAFLAARADFEVEPLADLVPPSVRPLVQESGFLVTWPQRHDLDGFFVARLKRRS